MIFRVNMAILGFHVQCLGWWGAVRKVSFFEQSWVPGLGGSGKMGQTMRCVLVDVRDCEIAPEEPRDI
jgi:hypothetical protein